MIKVAIFLLLTVGSLQNLNVLSASSRTLLTSSTPINDPKLADLPPPPPSVERMKTQHLLSLSEAEKKSPSGRHLEALKEMETKVLAAKKNYEDKIAQLSN